MDALFKRYAHPFSFIDGYIMTGRFCDFIDNFVETINEEKKDKAEWEIFLHKVWDKSYSEFKEQLTVNEENKKMTPATIETTVAHSVKILKSFNPEKQQKG